MFIHAFGAYFGLAVSRMIKPTKEITFDNEAATKTSDLFAMIGESVRFRKHSQKL